MFEKLEPLIKEYYTHGAHSFDHILRVYNVSLKLAKEMNADVEIVEAMALLHDIARFMEDADPTICHAAKGAEIAREILNKINFPIDKIDIVCEGIEKHRHSKGLISNTLEGKILADADRLETVGALAIGRIFYSGGKYNEKMYDPNINPNDKDDILMKTTTLGQFYRKNLKIDEDSFYTEYAKKIAKGRIKYLGEFVERYIKESNGEL